ncbi:unnamed protein product [Ectocarpus sp. 12 AP-2014]
MTLTLTVALVLIMTSVVAFILYRKSSDNTGSQNLGWSAKSRRENAKKKALEEQRRKLKDPCEWVQLLKKL